MTPQREIETARPHPRRKRIGAPNHRRRPAVRPKAPEKQAAIVLLGELLAGDTEWTLAEVRDLIALRRVADTGRWQASGLDRPSEDETE